MVRKLHAAVSQGMTTSSMDMLPPGLALPLLDSLHRCRHSPPAGVGRP